MARTVLINHSLLDNCLRRVPFAGGRMVLRLGGRATRGNPSGVKGEAGMCPFCGGQLSPHPSAVTCGAPDCMRERINERQREWQRRYREENGRWANAKYRGAEKSTCSRCRQEIVVGWQRTGMCRECRFALLRQTARRERAERKLLRALDGSCGRSVYAAGVCAWCGAWFVGRRDSRTCSSPCSAKLKAKWRRDRAGRAVSASDRHAVFVRDGWMCRLCGLRIVDRAATVPADGAPVVDHVVPLANGGTSDISNLQTAHFICNSYKRDLPDVGRIPLRIAVRAVAVLGQ